MDYLSVQMQAKDQKYVWVKLLSILRKQSLSIYLESPNESRSDILQTEVQKLEFQIK